MFNKNIVLILCWFFFSIVNAQTPVRGQNGSKIISGMTTAGSNNDMKQDSVMQNSPMQNRINRGGSGGNIPNNQPSMPSGSTQQQNTNNQLNSVEPQVYYSESLRPKNEKSVKIETENEFKLIGIKPYFKNKEKIAKLKITLISFDHSLTSELEESLGDCANCVRGASVKGKIGLRIHGDKIEHLTIKYKALSSVQVKRCTEGEKFVNQMYECEFDYKSKQYKLTLQIFSL